MTSSLLDRINTWMAKDGRGPGTPYLGDCPAVIEATAITNPMGGAAVRARLVVNISAAQAGHSHLSCLLARFLESMEAWQIEISHVLHDNFNRIQQGTDLAGEQSWVVDALFPAGHSAFSDLVPPAGTDDRATAPRILRAAAQAIDDRATLRDCPKGERSMGRCVAAFNAMFAQAIAANAGVLTETQGWQFMELLKLSRSTAGGHHLDDHTDRAAYAALAGEAAEREAAPL